MLGALTFIALGILVLLLYAREKGSSGRPTVSKPVDLPQRRTTLSMSDATWARPVTTNAAAAREFADLLARAGYARHDRAWLREATSEFRGAMRDHADELMSENGFLREEIANRREGILMHREDADDAETDRDKERAMARLSATRNELEDLTHKHQTMRAALDEFKADRSRFIIDFANHTMHGAPSPIHGRQ